MMKTNNLVILVILFPIMTLGWAVINYNLELKNHIDEITDYNSGSNFGVSDVWGYTDEIGIEYAIVGYRYGTFIYDVSSNPENPSLFWQLLK